MSVKIYLAARYSRYPEMQNYKKILEDLGYTVTSRWIDGHHNIVNGVSEEAAEIKRIQLAFEDLNDLLSSQCLICFTEIPRTTNTRGGRHVEFGIALAMRMSIIIIGPKETIFHTLPSIPKFNTFSDFMSSLAVYDIHSSPIYLNQYQQSKCDVSDCLNEATHHLCDDHLNVVTKNSSSDLFLADEKQRPFHIN